MGNIASFSLIDLVIFVAIIGILATIKTPSYRSHIVKAYLNRVADELLAYKTPLEGGVLSGGSIADTSIGYNPSNLATGRPGSDIGTLNPDGSGQPQVTMGGSAHPHLSGLVQRFERNTEGYWECVVDNTGAAPSWKPFYLLSGCRL